jgi:DNA-binding NarL/FixJ family response regulator
MPDGGNVSFEPRRTIAALDAERGRAMDCVDIWNRIVRGALRVKDSFAMGERAFLLLAQQTHCDAPMEKREQEILERLLLGESQKVLSFEMGLSVSFVAFLSKRALHAIGVETTTSKAPAILCLLVQSSRRAAPMRALRATDLELGGGPCIALSIPLHNSGLGCVLSPAERAVVSMRLEGRSLAEIAFQRQTSTRTVANQLGAACRRLGVSGRWSLVRHVVLTPERPVAPGPKSPASRRKRRNRGRAVSGSLKAKAGKHESPVSDAPAPAP